MNERILKLATPYFPRDTDGWISASDEDIVKFAELIVRECMRMCDVAEASLLTHGVREQSYGAADARRYISDWFEIEE